MGGGGGRGGVKKGGDLGRAFPLEDDSCIDCKEGGIGGGGSCGVGAFSLDWISSNCASSITVEKEGGPGGCGGGNGGVRYGGDLGRVRRTGGVHGIALSADCIVFSICGGCSPHESSKVCVCRSIECGV